MTPTSALLKHVADVAQCHANNGGDPFEYHPRVFEDVFKTLRHFQRLHYPFITGSVQDRYDGPEAL